MSIGDITLGTPSVANGTDTITPAIPGASSASSVLIATIFTRVGALTFTEDGSGAWNEFIDTNHANGSCACYWALGTETNAPVLNPSAGGNTTISWVDRVEGARTSDPIGTIGTYFSGTSSDNTVLVADPTPLESANGVVFCLAEQRGNGAAATSVAISGNSTGTWTAGQAVFEVTGADDNVVSFYNKFSSAPTLADETVTFTGGTPGSGQQGIMFEVVAELGKCPVLGRASGTLFGGLGVR